MENKKINYNAMDSEILEYMDQYFDERVDVYDDIHSQTGISWGIQIRDAIATYLPPNPKTILDLGCGTGLELEKIISIYPNCTIVCVDLSKKMLEKLKQKYPQNNIKVYQMNFFDYAYPYQTFDAVISVMALHHFMEQEKLKLYSNIHDCLKTNGIFINSDYIIDDENLEQSRFMEYQKICADHPGELFHFDIPFTEEREREVLEASGFKEIDKVYENKKTKILISK